MKRKILSSLIIIGIITTLAAGGTLAALNDVESSIDNVLQAGELNTKIGWEESRNNQEIETQEPTDDPGTIFDVKDIQPGETGEATISIKNIANPAFIAFYAEQTENKENGFAGKKKESKKKFSHYEPKDDTPEKGELGQELKFKLWYDDGDNVKQSDEGVIFDGTAHELGESLKDGYLLDADTQQNDIQPYKNGTSHIGFKWELPEDVDCNVQTDSKKFNFMFNAKQSRHNSNKILEPFVYFEDRELILNNHFKAGVFDKCEKDKKKDDEKEDKKDKKEKEKVCKPIIKPEEGEEDIDRYAEKKGHEEVEYDIEHPSDNEVKYVDADEALGDHEKVVTDTYEVTVEGEKGHKVYVDMETDGDEYEFELKGEDDEESLEDGKWKAQIIDIDEDDGETTYSIALRSDNEESKLEDLDHISFKFCKKEYVDDGKKQDEEDEEKKNDEKEDDSDEDEDKDDSEDHKEDDRDEDEEKRDDDEEKEDDDEHKHQEDEQKEDRDEDEEKKQDDDEEDEDEEDEKKEESEDHDEKEDDEEQKDDHEEDRDEKKEEDEHSDEDKKYDDHEADFEPIDDFESYKNKEELRDYYKDDEDNYEPTDEHTAPGSDTSIKSESTYVNIGADHKENSEFKTPSGRVYSVYIMMDDDEGSPGFLIQNQDPDNARDSSYHIKTDIDDEEFQMFANVDKEHRDSDEEDYEFETEQWYRVEAYESSSIVIGRVYKVDEDGSEELVAGPLSVEKQDELAGGGFGFYGGGEHPTYFDDPSKTGEIAE